MTALKLVKQYHKNSNYTYGYCHGNACVWYSDALCQTVTCISISDIKGQSVGIGVIGTL